MTIGKTVYVTLKAYNDSKCVYGYMVICPDCKKSAPYWVDTSRAIQGFKFPDKQCELCKRPGQQ